MRSASQRSPSRLGSPRNGGQECPRNGGSGDLRYNRRGRLGWICGVMILMGAWVGTWAADPAVTPVADPQPLLQQLQRTMASLESVQFDFVQERHLQLFEEPLRSEGAMLIARPDQIRWEVTSPYQSILLGNSRTVAQFEKTDQEWKKLKVGFPGQLRQVMNQMVLMHRGDMEALNRDFTISLATGEVARVTLVPRDESIQSFLASIEVQMALDFSVTREVLMREPGGDATRIVFRREQRDVKFPDGTFDQARPLDLAVIREAVEKGR